MLRFPALRIMDRPGLERSVVRAAWSAVPLQFYLLQSFGRGFAPTDFASAAVVTLISFLLLFVLSAALAAVPNSAEGNFDSRMRTWSISLIIAWVATLGLFAAATAIYQFPPIGKQGRVHDPIEDLVCNTGWACMRSPPTLAFQTIVIVLIYTVLALALVRLAMRRLRLDDCSMNCAVARRDPSMLVVWIVTSALVTGVNVWAAD